MASKAKKATDADETPHCDHAAGLCREQVGAPCDEPSEGALATRNEAWGFFGTWNGAAWAKMTALTFERVGAVLVADFGLKPAAARDFLDSSTGRHLADAMLDRLNAAHARACAAPLSGVPTMETLRACLPEWTAKEVKRWKTAGRSPRRG